MAPTCPRSPRRTRRWLVGWLVGWSLALKLYGVNATIIIFVFVLYCIVFYCIVGVVDWASCCLLVVEAVA